MTFEAEKVGNFLVGPVDFTLPHSTTMCVSGESGSGKTVLLRCLADLVPHTGEIRLDGITCSSMSPPEWRRQVGLLPAEPAWWHPLVGQHFTASAATGFTELGFPPEVVSWQADRLSSGEKQRLSLLRLLQNKPKVLLLDEPTANLDARATELVEKYIREWQQQHQAAVVWVSHNREQIERVADVQYVLVQGGLMKVAA